MVFPVQDTKKSIMAWSGAAIIVELILVALYFRAPNAYIWLATEDKLGENLTSLFYLAAGILMLATVMVQMRKGIISIAAIAFPVLLGAFFIFVGGEEISWGQRLFGLETPEAIRERNVQGELTLHNLDFFDRNAAVINQHTALNAFALLMGLVIPWVVKFVRPLGKLARWMNFPVIPLALSPWFFVGLVHAMTVAKIDLHWSHSEIKELVFALGFFLFSLDYFIKRERAGESSQISSR